MKVINSDNGLPMLLRIFRHLQRRQSLLVVWQMKNGRRNVYHATLGSFHIDKRSVSFSFTEKHNLNPAEEFFFYAEDGEFIFKTGVIEMNGNHFNAHFPDEVKLLDELDALKIPGKSNIDIQTHYNGQRLILDGPEIYDDFIGRVPKAMKDRSSRDQDFLKDELDMTVDEEDKMFADKRESVRVRPKANKIVKLMLKDDPNIHVLKLFDLSQGGMAFVTLQPEMFPKGKEVVVIGFGEFELDDPLIGTIMSIRATDEVGVEHKIGIKFNEGQG